MAYDERFYTVWWPDTDYGHVSSDTEFVVENIDDQETIDAARALAIGESVELGGGSAPVVVVTRVSADEALHLKLHGFSSECECAASVAAYVRAHRTGGA